MSSIIYMVNLRKVIKQLYLNVTFQIVSFALILFDN